MKGLETPMCFTSPSAYAVAAHAYSHAVTSQKFNDERTPQLPLCASGLTYQDGALFICPECGHEWSGGEAPAAADEVVVHKDAVGNVLAEGDSVTITKDLKVKGASSALKAGTKVRNIRLVEGDHNIDCKIDGFGPMKLKSEFVKKA